MKLKDIKISYLARVHTQTFLWSKFRFTTKFPTFYWTQFRLVFTSYGEIVTCMVKMLDIWWNCYMYGKIVACFCSDVSFGSLIIDWKAAVSWKYAVYFVYVLLTVDSPGSKRGSVESFILHFISISILHFVILFLTRVHCKKQKYVTCS